MLVGLHRLDRLKTVFAVIVTLLMQMIMTPSSITQLHLVKHLTVRKGHPTNNPHTTDPTVHTIEDDFQTTAGRILLHPFPVKLAC
jgi:hypothetical protein